jgi:protein transport protein SEC24
MIPASQLPPSKSYPSVQHLQQQQQPMPTIPQHNVVPPSQFQQPTSMAPPVNNNNNESSQASHPNLSASMKNLTLNNPVTTFPSSTPTMPSSKSDQNLLNNNNMQQQPLKPLVAMQKRPMYPQQPQAMPPMPQQQQAMPQQQSQTLNQPVMQQQPVMSQPQPHQFNSFPGVQQPPQQPNLAQQPRGNLQYQNFPQQQQPQAQTQQQQAPGIVQQGFNRLWGRESVDLLQNRHILPQTKVLPPPVKLNHQFHEAANCSPDIFRCTLTKIPESNSLLQKSRLPLGILIHPYRDLSVSALTFRLSATRFTFFFDFSFRIFLLSAAPRLSAVECVAPTSIHLYFS